jgi:hypothetical protein
MIRVTVEIRERAINRRVRVTASSIGQALDLAGRGKPGREVSVVFPIDPESFFAGDAAQEATVPVYPSFTEAA